MDPVTAAAVLLAAPVAAGGVAWLAYRLGLTPWERYGRAAAPRIGALLDREEGERWRPLGRAIDLGCGRGQKTHELARRGWEAVGVDNIPRAIEAADRKGSSGATFVVGDVTDLAPADLGTFDFFLDAGCFQHLDSEQRLAEGRGIEAAFEEIDEDEVLEHVDVARIDDGFVDADRADLARHAAAPAAVGLAGRVHARQAAA